ncbi:4-hydroxyproline epimerase [Anditalea andensis]|uniref:Hydroxyproline-2-epimerase n=1 Tax=Anditalea andensis TaxID=1048983 RepID=A0A074KWB2_9BACT|nr:4-hydroxyproline epimerase [Anditalea andensis]KEO71903.1 hydroxyproline-2-epimerase [Anditalea andensis]
MKNTFSCIDGHTCGNPVRLVIGGGPLLKGENMFEKRRHFLEEFDWVRKGLMFEPRGHDMMSGSILYSPSDPNNDVGVLFIETSGCLPMCGHGLIGTVTMAVEEGIITPKQEGVVRVETPAGLVTATYQKNGDKVTAVKITNVPSFLLHTDLSIDHQDLGRLTFDVAYGGNFYAIVDPQENFPGIHHYSAEELIRLSRKLREGINQNFTAVHPENPNISGISHILWTGNVLYPTSDARNAVFYGDKAIDRSPCGTGTSARMAQLFFKGRLKVGDSFIHESFIGSVFKGQVSAIVKVGGYEAIIPTIEGWAIKTGYNTIFLDNNDPYVHGFQVI